MQLPYLESAVYSYTTMAKPIRALELHYPVIQFFIKEKYLYVTIVSGVAGRACFRFHEDCKQYLDAYHITYKTSSASA